MSKAKSGGGTFGRVGGKNWTDKFDAVAINSIYEESFRKELQFHSLKEEYSTHPGKIDVVTDKPNKRGKKFLDKDQALLQNLVSKLSPEQLERFERTTGEPVHSLLSEKTTSENEETHKEQLMKTQNEDRHFLETRENLAKKPTDRYNQPQTSAQEAGWYHKFDSTNRASAVCFKPKKSCPETLFANQLVQFKANIRSVGGPNTKAAAASKK